MTPFDSKSVQVIFDSYPDNVKKNLFIIRQLIFDIASESDEIGVIHETLKWQQPSYLTSKPKSGTTIRLAYLESSDFAIYVHCQTSLIADFKEIYPELRYDGNRAIVLNCRQKMPLKIIEDFIYLALSYHCRKQRH